MEETGAETPGRSRASRVVQTVLTVSIIVLAVSALYISVLVFQRQEALSQIFRYNIAFSASQGMNELLRFRQRVAGLLVDPPQTTKQDVELRYQILLSRMSLFDSGEFKNFVNDVPDTQQTVADMSRVVHEISTFIGDIDEKENALRALELTAPLERQMVSLASQANEYGATLQARDQNELLRLHWIFSLLALGLVVSGFIFVAMLRWQHRLQISVQERLRATNEDLLRTSAELIESAEAARLANEELSTQNLLFNTALNNMSHGLCMFDAEQELIVSNRKMESIYGLKSDQVKPGVSLSGLVESMVESGACREDEAHRIADLQTKLIKQNRSDTLIQELRDGRTILISHQPMKGGGWVATYEDITERHKAQAQVAYMARHDTLTDLPNRLMMRERLEEILQTSSERGLAAAVMCIDLDNFKSINDTLGHPIGDALLRAVAGRIRNTVRESDCIARLGGDEFVVVQGNLEKLEQASTLAKRLILAIDAPYLIDGHQILTSASVGISTTIDSREEVDDLLMQADVALYQAKADGRGVFRFYERGMNKRLQRRRALEAELRSANLDEQFHLVFQPIIDLGMNKVTAFEALLRWTHPTLGPIPPDEFISIAEDTGAIVPLGEWVLRQVCLETKRLPDDISIAANLSPMQFKRDDIVSTVARLLEETETEAHRLELEITETLLLEDNRKLHADLRRLRKLGSRISLDDFGTGYSSLSYLQKFAFDKVKIDRLFIKDITKSADQAAIVQTILNLSYTLGMTTVVEGVETEEQLRIIRAMGGSEAQGNLFSKPIRSEEIAEFLAEHKRKRSAA
ncbi:putative bifunctional diguanylate cyclase/phosphodiesterase [Nitratireductor indicus]|uniref:Diguanylate cyclase n=1 Tax=Nitratireductor indicus C115 TaxID=1231190 RepID=K2NRE8_9HYPH|nr:EAL domain-containing protein [Nitratireductor indicus]EKF40424.1 diguanylate cyclase [Nitratireductor indicus C115]MDS1136332.1 EAL domain-containing protein [Nitratireductor indicus]SFQ77100.1 diguanylate cyclase (GGDEF) domain-containing protein [Nitratireductor indicus]